MIYMANFIANVILNMEKTGSISFKVGDEARVPNFLCPYLI